MNNSQIDNTLVSIIVVTYNSANYVTETLESAKSQRYLNIELIVTDDCSTDNTVEVCRLWMEKNKTRFVNLLVLTTKNNTGIAGNCNRGVKASKGEWIKLIAGDDLLFEDCIIDNLKFVVQNPKAKFVTSKMQNINEKSEYIEQEETNYEAFRKQYYLLSAAKQLKAYSRLPVFLNSPAFFVKREILEAVDYFDEEFKIFDDMCLIYRINGIGEKVFYFDEYTVKYRVHLNSISRSTNSKIDERRRSEQLSIFNKYRKKNLDKLNPIDLSIYYESWLNFQYEGFFGHKGINILLKISAFHWVLKFLNCRNK